WPYWLEEGILDYVVLMNYTQDKQLTKEIVRASLGYRQKGKVLVGMGLYLMKDNPEVFFELYKMVKNLSADGIVIFSYDDMTEEILEYLSKSQ
ncbi:MAG: hypothetical protein PHV58_04710, partial [Candidatus Omnitrophica bacterium]|nr:hypothetical protein [Candidatus Omnitrophota bacterium]